MEKPDYAVIARDYLAKTGLDANLTEEEKARFINYAKTYNLDPYKREIHCIVDDDGYKVVVGYETYIKRAEATGVLNGWTSWIEGTDDSMKAVVEIYRKDWANPFRHEVYLKEALQKDKEGHISGFWAKMPRLQLRKVAISQGFRLCFAQELGGIAYEPAEISATDIGLSVTTPPKGYLAQVAEEKAVTPTPVPMKAAGNPADELEKYLEDNKEAFTERHLSWIRNKLAQDPTDSNARKMLSYAKKVVSGEKPQTQYKKNWFPAQAAMPPAKEPAPVF